jgi:hypothetical protein
VYQLQISAQQSELPREIIAKAIPRYLDFACHKEGKAKGSAMVLRCGGVKAVPAKQGAVPRHPGSVSLMNRRINAQSSLLPPHPVFHLTWLGLTKRFSSHAG